ncbi:8-amino-7-oxononanoate synthase [Aliidiomarina taiwanensis]|uniref:8-amino-7-oxononanoate synthase n=1 Tax=Aliidiomarina taiwanensis TaxID=946228 RepID=A0A432XA43_9GAMM|nr:8-amino-7-oxononanoate synthase [Aliidiomarina taiwanensis]RUO44190.1 8-amino-7-oxononanoate synthase [Aliidiomarina taiwanensis]
MPHLNAMGLQQQLKAFQQARKEKALWRSRQVTAMGTRAFNFSSNDYLALSTHPKVIQAFQQGLEVWGAGSGGSPLTTGYQGPHQALEEALCAWLGVESVLLFNSGYAANQACMKALTQLGAVPALDRLSHASLYAGALSGAAQGQRLLRFHHNHVEHARKQLNTLPHSTPGVLVTEGLFSMDGDSAPLADFIALKADQKKHGRNTLLFVDDAHGLGARGQAGRGSVPASYMSHIDLLTATFGKALGCQGAFVAGDKAFIEYLVQTAGEYIYSTAMPAAQACAVLAAIELVQDESLALQQQLATQVKLFQQEATQLGIPLLLPEQGPVSAILPCVLGSADKALRLSQQLQQQGITAVAIRPPTVPQGKARVRFTISLQQTPQSIQQTVQALHQALQQQSAPWVEETQ